MEWAESRPIHLVPIVDKCPRTTISVLVALREWAVFKRNFCQEFCSVRLLLKTN